MAITESHGASPADAAAMYWDAVEGFALLARMARPTDPAQLRLLIELLERMRDRAAGMERERLSDLLAEAVQVQEQRLAGI